MSYNKYGHKILFKKVGEIMSSGLIYDEEALIDDQVYKYDQFLHNRVNKYTGAGRTITKYWNINDANTTMSLGMGTHYRILGDDSPLRYDCIDRFPIIGFSPLQPEDKQASTTQVKDYTLNGEGYIIPGTIMPKENDFFIVKHLNMNHLFRVTKVGQDGLNANGMYKINYELFSTNPNEIDALKKQTVGEYVSTFETIGGEDLTPIIGKEDYDLRSRLIRMVNDMIENYKARYYDSNHNCFLLHLNGRTLFDVCGNMFMAKHGIMINDASNGNVVLNPNKIRDDRLEHLYQKSPYKWIERDAPQRYLDSFKYHIVSGFDYPDSTFAMYGYDVSIMIPVDPWCASPNCTQYFPDVVIDVLDNEADSRMCHYTDCRRCPKASQCAKHWKCQRYDYVSIIHDFIYGRLTDIHKLSLYTGDQLFDNAEAEEIYLWTPIVIYILKEVLKIK